MTIVIITRNIYNELELIEYFFIHYATDYRSLKIRFGLN